MTKLSNKSQKFNDSYQYIMHMQRRAYRDKMPDLFQREYYNLNYEKDHKKWVCPECTLNNDIDNMRCEACNAKKPDSPIFIFK